MVLILDGNSEHAAHTCGKTGRNWGKNLNKCLMFNIKLHIPLFTYEPISELPSEISTMIQKKPRGTDLNPDTDPKKKTRILGQYNLPHFFAKTFPHFFSL